MRTVVLALLAALAMPAWPAEDILDVLDRSQRMQLSALADDQADAASAEAQTVQHSFDRLVGLLDVPPDVRLIVVHGPLVAVCLMGRTVAANVSLASLTENERLFVLAHELGHIALGHWQQVGALYKRYIPDDVVQDHTDAIAGALGREASELSHEQEYQADAFALRVLRRLGEPDDTPVVLFQQHLPPVKSTATHPSTQQRIAHLRTVY